MIDLKSAIHTNLLLVDDDIGQLELRAMALKMSGFTVLTAGSPIEAISTLAHHPVQNVHVAILDYHMPVMNGCVLADYLKGRYPHLKIILYSAVIDIPENEMSSVDVFVSKAEGIAALLAQISEFTQVHTSSHGAWFSPDSYLGLDHSPLVR